MRRQWGSTKRSGNASNKEGSFSAWSMFSGLEIAKEISKLVVVGAFGYLSALLISPDQLYRYLFLPNPNDYTGVWHGVVSSQSARLEISKQFGSKEGGAFRLFGVLVLGGSGIERSIEVEGPADGDLVLRGDWDSSRVITLSLKRVVPETRSADNRYISLEPRANVIPVSLCPKPTTPNDILNPSECKSLEGQTIFFRGF